MKVMPSVDRRRGRCGSRALRRPRACRGGSRPGRSPRPSHRSTRGRGRACPDAAVTASLASFGSGSRSAANATVCGQRPAPPRRCVSPPLIARCLSWQLTANPTGPRGAGESLLVRAVLRGAAPRAARRSGTADRRASSLEVALMFGLGLIGPAHVLGLPGPLAVAIAAVVGIVARPRHAAVVAAAGCLAYLVFLSDFGREVPYHVVAISSVLWIGMPWVIARAGHSLRRQVLARQNAQLEMEDLYHGLEQGLLPRRRTSHPRLHAVDLLQARRTASAPRRRLLRPQRPRRWLPRRGDRRRQRPRPARRRR